MRRDLVFDLHLLRVSGLTIAAGYALMAFAPTGFIFTLCYMVTTLGQGFVPAVQSVTTILYASASDQDNAGRLFSALGVAYGLGWVPLIWTSMEDSHSVNGPVKWPSFRPFAFWDRLFEHRVLLPDCHLLDRCRLCLDRVSPFGVYSLAMPAECTGHRATR